VHGPAKSLELKPHPLVQRLDQKKGASLDPQLLVLRGGEQGGGASNESLWHIHEV
jgi:hypothetical protein